MTFKRYLIPGFIVLGLILLLSACGGGGSSSSEGTSVSFKFELDPLHDSSGQAQPQLAGIKQFENSEGRSIKIQSGYLVLWSITLESDCAHRNFTSATPWLDWFIGSAQAHAVSNEFTLGVPHVINLNATEAEPVTLGTIAPPVNDYCGITAELLKADSDTLNLPVTPDMVGLSFYIQGEYLSDNATDWISFEISSGKSLLPAQRLLALPIQLSAASLSDSVTLLIPYHRWFDAVDFSQINSSAQIDMILTNISSTISVTQ